MKKTKSGKYQKFVFDISKRRFVGRFESMYAAEDRQGFDSWQQDTLTTLQKRVSLAVLDAYNFDSILDFGCGKAAFTHLLKKANNRVLGTDMSPTAIKKARVRYPDIEFRVLAGKNLPALKEHFDLAVAMEVFSFIPGWRQVLKDLARKADRLYVTLHVPPNPIGFVPDFESLRVALRAEGEIETELILDNRVLCALVKVHRRR
jgi:SAM-dependent methyltransferase